MTSECPTGIAYFVFAFSLFIFASFLLLATPLTSINY